MALNFTNRLWLAITVIEVVLVTARVFLRPGPVRLSLALLMPTLIIFGAIANAIYNRLTTGHAIDDFTQRKPR